MRRVAGGVLMVVALLAGGQAGADDCPPCPPPPPEGWIISVGGGFALTGGNSDSKSYNFDANVTYDPKKSNLFRFEALYLRTDQDGVPSADRTFAKARDEYTVSGRFFVFGELGYQRDRFKEVDYLIAPMAGAGYRLVDKPKVLLATDASLGVAFEKLTGLESTTDLALQATERMEWKVGAAATLVQKGSGLWKADDFGDAYYRGELGLTSTLAKRLDLKLAFVDDYKTRPQPGLEKNDTSFLVAFLFKP